MSAKPFLDSNIILTLLSEDEAKADRADGQQRDDLHPQPTAGKGRKHGNGQQNGGNRVVRWRGDHELCPFISTG